MPARWASHVPAVSVLAVLSLVWTWPLALHLRNAIPGLPGDNYSFLWNLWWMRKALASPELEFFQSTYLFSPFGVDLINHPHTALQGYLSATLLAKLSIIEAENLYIVCSVFLNAACAYALAFEVVGSRRLALLAGVLFGGSPYVAAHLNGHFDLLTAWVLPLFVLFLRRAIDTGSWLSASGAGACVAIAAYSAYYHVVYLGLMALAYIAESWRLFRFRHEPRPPTRGLFTVRLIVLALMTLVAIVVAVIGFSGGGQVNLGGVAISATHVQNPLFLLWLLAGVWLLTKWRVSVRLRLPRDADLWRGVQALAVSGAVFALLSLPLVVQAFRLVLSGRYVSQVYFWRSAPRGVDLLAPLAGNPFHPIYGQAVSAVYERLGLDRIDAVGWIGIVPLLVLLAAKAPWHDGEEARRWKAVLAVFVVWALGPFLTAAGFDLGLPLPQALARFIPLVENARMPGRAMVGVYLALGMLVVLRLAGQKTGTFSKPAVQWALIALVAVDYLHAPIPLTALQRPAVFEELASIRDEGAVIAVPFGIGDGLSVGRGSQDRRLLFDATIHGHPVVGGYIGRMPPLVANAYEAMPVVGNLLRLSNGEEAVEDDRSESRLPFRYLVLDTKAASAELIDYVHATLDMDLLASADDLELYAVQGVKRVSATARTMVPVLSSVVDG